MKKRTHVNRGSGFTLIELMIVVAIVAILASIAYPSYVSQIRKTRRADCKDALYRVAQQIERCRSVYGAYDHASCSIADGDSVASEEAYYSVAVDSAAGTFTLACGVGAGGVQAGDTVCTEMSLTHTGLKQAEDDSGADTTDVCW